MKKIVLPLAALALIGAPVAAQSIRATAPIDAESELDGGPSIFALALVAGIAALGIIAVVDDDDDEAVSG
ncbi:MAG: hypothetical protein AAFQ90_00935 [Pseudomonadota bacterium]